MPLGYRTSFGPEVSEDYSTFTTVSANLFVMLYILLKMAHFSQHWMRKWVTYRSIPHHILGTVHHLIIIFGTHIYKMVISPGVFFTFLKNFVFLGC